MPDISGKTGDVGGAGMQNVDLEELINEAEVQFRRGVAVLSEWSETARELIRDRPGAVLAGVAVLGFVTGLLLRRNASEQD